MTKSRETWDASGDVPDARSLIGGIRVGSLIEASQHPLYEPGIPHEIQEAGIVRRVALRRQVTETTGTPQVDLVPDISTAEVAFDAVGTEGFGPPTSSM